MYALNSFIYVCTLRTYVGMYLYCVCIRMLLYTHTYIYTICTYVYYQSMYVCTAVIPLHVVYVRMQMMSDADELFMRSSDNQRPRSKPVHRRNKVRVCMYVYIHSTYFRTQYPTTYVCM